MRISNTQVGLLFWVGSGVVFMDETLIDDETIPLSRRSRLPGAGFFSPDSRDDDRADERAKETLAGAEAAVVTDTDADGLACAALIREMYDAALDASVFEAALADRLADSESAAETAERAADTFRPGDTETEDDESDDESVPDEDAVDLSGVYAESSVALIGAGPYSLVESLERVAEYAAPGIDVFVCDIAPDEYEPVAEPLTSLTASCDRVSWYDHHQWDDSVIQGIRELGVDLVVGESDEECSADVTLRSLEYDFSQRFAELAAVTRDHDLWLKEDPRSDDLADYSYWGSTEEYAAVVGAYGGDLPETVQAFLAHQREEKQRRIEAATDRATTHEIGPWKVAVTYGRCSQNEVAENLRQMGADAAVIVKPAGSASIRGSDGDSDDTTGSKASTSSGRPGFALAHEVAGRVNGGGHPQAAGCKPDIYDDMLDYAHHWSSEGRAAKRVILAAFETVAGKVEAGELSAGPQ